MKLNKSPALTFAYLTAMAALLSSCASANVISIPDSLKAPCESTVTVAGAQTVADLDRAILAGDADLAVCSAKKDAVVAIAESGKRRWWLW